MLNTLQIAEVSPPSIAVNMTTKADLLTAPRCSTSEEDRTADATTPSRLQREPSTDAGERLSDKFQSACATSPVAPGRAQ
jgi:hypothetical protein